jgi:large subunit ribosomal protein L23
VSEALLDAYRILRRPRLTEKGNYDLEKRNAYAFEVPLDANKIEVRKAVETLYGVKVVSVRTMRRRGKVRRRGFHVGRKSDWKKAIVRLKTGERIEVY